MSFFGKNIKKIRGVKKLSQQAFADVFGLKRATLGAYEEGRSEPKIDTIIKVANYFSLTIDDLLTKDMTVNELLRFKTDVTTNLTDLVKEQFVPVPCVTTLQLNEFVVHFNQENYAFQLPKLVLPLEAKKKYLAYEVQNLEMSVNDLGFFPKDIIVAEETSVLDVEQNKVVLVLFEEDLVLRRWFVDGDQCVLKADHTHVDAIVRSLKDIKAIWQVVSVFQKKVSETNSEVNSQLESFAKEMQLLKKRIEKL